MKILKTTKNERHYTERKIIFRLEITSYQIHKSPEDNGIIYIRWRCMRSGQGSPIQELNWKPNHGSIWVTF
uniref:Uncharacterized protein n=1 Tax=Mustela putorius furo TaxID=9669 RepID=M3XPS4_MUSPF